MSVTDHRPAWILPMSARDYVDREDTSRADARDWVAYCEQEAHRATLSGRPELAEQIRQIPPFPPTDAAWPDRELNPDANELALGEQMHTDFVVWQRHQVEYQRDMIAAERDRLAGQVEEFARATVQYIEKVTHLERDIVKYAETRDAIVADNEYFRAERQGFDEQVEELRAALAAEQAERQGLERVNAEQAETLAFHDTDEYKAIIAEPFVAAVRTEAARIASENVETAAERDMLADRLVTAHERGWDQAARIDTLTSERDELLHANAGMVGDNDQLRAEVAGSRQARDELETLSAERDHLAHENIQLKIDLDNALDMEQIHALDPDHEQLVSIGQRHNRFEQTRQPAQHEQVNGWGRTR